MEAKIGDLGTLCLVDLAKQSVMTAAPDTIHFMPPEALAANPQNASLWQGTRCVLVWLCDAPHIVTDPVTFEMKARSEVERRRSYFDWMC